MKQAFIILLILFFLFNSILLSQSTSNLFFPLAIGNEWHFMSNLFEQTESVTDTVQINSKLYYKINSSLGSHCLIRESDDKIFIIDITDSSEVVLYNFAAEIGEYWKLNEYFNCSFGDSVTLLSKSDTVITPSGTFNNCYHFKHFVYCNDAGIHDSWFTKGVGKVRFIEVFWSGSGNFLLTNYIITSVGNRSEMPKNCELFQNYPNPFNPSTKISWQSPVSSWQTLIVFDVLGREVATLVNEEKPAGSYEVEFNASQLPSGVYFYQLKSGNFIQTKKMSLIK